MYTALEKNKKFHTRKYITYRGANYTMRLIQTNLLCQSAGKIFIMYHATAQGKLKMAKDCTARISLAIKSRNRIQKCTGIHPKRAYTYVE